MNLPALTLGSLIWRGLSQGTVKRQASHKHASQTNLTKKFLKRCIAEYEALQDKIGGVGHRSFKAQGAIPQGGV